MIGLPRTRRWAALSGAMAASLLLPALALRLAPVEAVDIAIQPVKPLTPRYPPASADAIEGSLFAAADGDMTADTALRLAGIAGRFPGQAVALVRGSDGTLKTMAIGDSHEGWTLTALAPAAAQFAKGRDTLRLDLPPAEATALPSN
jgi:hypothetical protein